MKSKIISFVLCVCCTIQLLAADSGSCGDYCRWTLDDSGKLTITGNGEMYDYMYDGKNVPWLLVDATRKSIKEISISEGITHIGDYSFSNCVNLTSVSLPTSLMSIGKDAFSATRNLKSITLPDNLEIIKSGAFSVSGITSITIPDKITKLADYVFGMSKLDSIKFPSNLQEIGSGCFLGTNFYRITIPNTVTSIGERAFNGCRLLTQISLPNNITQIPDGLLSGCTVLNEVLNISDIESIGAFAFQFCTSLDDIPLPQSIKSIGDGAFWGCEKLQDIGNIQLHSNLEHIGANAFNSCKALKNINISHVDSIYEHTFYQCSSLTNAYLSSQLKYIGQSAFEECNSLQSVSFSAQTAFIGQRAFYNCKQLTKVDMSLAQLTSIPEFAFSNCYSLKQLSLPNSLISIEGEAFANCTLLPNLILPTNLTSIGSASFRGCSQLSSVDMSQAMVKDISYSAFSKCSKLSTLLLSNSLLNIGESAFADCISLYDITLPDNVVSIHTNSFNNTGYYNTNSNWDNGLLYIGKYLIAANTQTIEHATSIREGTCLIAHQTFLDNDSLYAIILPNSLRYIGDKTFSKCDSIKEIPLPSNQLEVIGHGAFSYCTSIDTIKIPASVDSIGSSLIAGCTNLKFLQFSNPNPKGYIVYNPYSYPEHYQGVVEVPCNSVDIYKQLLHYWPDATFQEQSYPYNYDVESNNDNYVADYILNCANRTVEVAIYGYNGYYFVKWEDGNTDNPRIFEVYSDTIFKVEISNQYVINVDCNSEEGNVMGGGTYTYGTEVTLTATPKHGYEFSYWYVDGYTTGYNNPNYTFTVEKDYTIEAIFTTANYNVSVQSENEEKGYAYASRGNGQFPYLTSIELTATPNYGYRFKQWSDGNTDNPRPYIVEDNAIIIAEFAPDSFMVYDYSNEAGYTTGGGLYPYMSEIQVTAIPNEGYDFVSWFDNGSSELTTTITVNGEIYLSPFFERHLYNITINSDNIDMGYVNYIGNYQYYYNDEILLVAYPSYPDMYEFDHWSDGNTDNPRTYIVQSDVEIIAYFRIAGTGLENISLTAPDAQIYTLFGLDVTTHKDQLPAGVYIIKLGNQTNKVFVP